MEKLLQETAEIFNHVFHTEPLLYASFCLEKILQKQDTAKDIDLLIPHEILNQKDDLRKVFQSRGFSVQQKVVLTLKKNGIEIELADQEKWFGLCGFQKEDIHVVRGFEFCYQMLGLENLLKLYQFLAKDPERPLQKRNQDQIKIAEIKKKLSLI